MLSWQENEWEGDIRFHQVKEIYITFLTFKNIRLIKSPYLTDLFIKKYSQNGRLLK